jgi:hypothetical protein
MAVVYVRMVNQISEIGYYNNQKQPGDNFFRQAHMSIQRRNTSQLKKTQ